jgi:hypothetical protein
VFYFSAHIVHVSIDAKQEKLYRRYDRKHEYRIQVCEDSYKYSDKMCVIRYTQCICKTPAPNWQPILKSMSDFHVTDICTSDLSHFFKFSNWHPILKSMSFFKFLNRLQQCSKLAVVRWWFFCLASGNFKTASPIGFWNIFHKKINDHVNCWILAFKSNNCIQPRPSWWDIPCFKNNFTSES